MIIIGKIMTIKNTQARLPMYLQIN